MMQIRYGLLALLLLPVIAGAQMGRSGLGSKTGEADAKRARSALDRDAPPPMKLKVGDIEEMSPVKMLLDKRKSLKLSDEQQAGLKALDVKVDLANEPLLAKFDSLRLVMRPRQHPTDEELVRMAIGREELGPLIRSIRANYAAAVPSAVALLDDAQKAMAQGLLEEQAKDANDTLRENLGRAGGGPPGGGVPGGGRGRPPLGG